MRAVNMRAQLACSMLVAVSSLVAAQSSGFGVEPSATFTAPAALPTVDLGYEIYRANSFNQTGQFYNFSNVRYAAPPIADLRFRAPQAPAVNRSHINDGSSGRICPQAIPAWIELAVPFLSAYFTNKPFNSTIDDLNKLNSSITVNNAPKMDSRTSEDCLFLDVVVPANIFQNAGRGYGAPVLVWIYGGGYTEGEKAGNNPAGLIWDSEKNNRGGAIYVSLNYRLGAFGWLAGPTFQEDGTANAGLYDQRFALEWVKANIHKFGGDPNRVTVFGESAGGGSIMHQLTAYGGSVPAPFQQAVLQSAAWLPLVSNYQQDATLNEFLTLLGVSTIEEARQLPTDKLIAANYAQVWHSAYGSFTYGPAVDGSFVPAMPGKLMLQGSFNKNVTVMTGKNTNEGILFTDPFLNSSADFNTLISQFLPTANPAVLKYIENTLYPPPPYSNGSLSYTTVVARAAAAVSEAVFTCNSYYIDTAYAAQNKSYGYLFSVPPGYHGEDIGYTYYNNGGFDFGSLLLNVSSAIALQDWITTFAQYGYPSSPDITGLPVFSMYGTNQSIENDGLSSIITQTDPQANYRCKWWQKALYL